MLQIAVFCLLILQVIAAGPPPPQCRGAPGGLKNPRECCDIPKVFKEEDFKECGIEKPSEDVESFRHRGPPDCNKEICMLKRNNLMKDDTDIDKDAVEAFMQKWADDNEDFKDAVDVAVERCLKGDLPGPPEFCEATKNDFLYWHYYVYELSKMGRY